MTLAKDFHQVATATYNPINTDIILDTFGELGWTPKSYAQRGDKPDAYHVVRLVKEGEWIGRDSTPEIVISNSHNHNNALKIHAGVFRLVCANGMTLGEDYVPPVRILHRNVDEDAIFNAVSVMQESFKQILDYMDRMQDRVLTVNEKSYLLEGAMDALGLKYDFLSNTNLLPRRYEDNSNNLWSNFNVVQEKMTRGGLHYANLSNSKRPYQTTRVVKDSHRALEANKKLFDRAIEILES